MLFTKNIIVTINALIFLMSFNFFVTILSCILTFKTQKNSVTIYALVFFNVLQLFVTISVTIKQIKFCDHKCSHFFQCPSTFCDHNCDNKANKILRP